MANLVPEMISVLRDIRDIKYPNIVTKHNDVVVKHADVVSYDTLCQSYVASTLANKNATALDKTATNADVVLTHADVVKTNADAVTCTAKALIASQVLAMTAEASTLTAGSPASASYNPTNGKMSFGIPTGPKGDKGDAFVVNAVGTLVGRDAYDLQPANFTYYATDVGLIYFKLSATSGDWSVGSPFGKGDTGDTGNGIASITLTGTVGSVDTYRILYTDATFFDFNVTNGSVTSVAGRTGDVVLTKNDVGLNNVNNTSDADKPVSTAQQTALNLKANISGATFSGQVKGIAPVANEDLTRKDYVDTAIQAASLPTITLPVVPSQYKIHEIAGVIRYYSGIGWRTIYSQGGTDHPVLGVSTVTSTGSIITVNFDTSEYLTNVGVISFVASPDDTLASFGVTCGASVGLTKAEISLKVGAVSDYIYYNGTTWLSLNGVFSGFSFSGGVLTFNSPTVIAPTSVMSVSGRGSSTTIAMGGGFGSVTSQVEFRDFAGALITTPSTNMRCTVSFDSSTINTVDDDAFVAPANIWFTGKMVSWEV